jgi:MFS family permease
MCDGLTGHDDRLIPAYPRNCKRPDLPRSRAVNIRSLSISTRNAAPVRRLIASPSWQGGFSSGPFRLFALAQLFTFTALVGQFIVRGWMVQELTDSPFLVSLVPSLHLLPGLVIGPAGGYLADRLSRKLVVFWGEVVVIAAYAILAVLSAMGEAQAWHVLATTALIGVSYALSSPSRQALIVDTVPSHLERRAVGSYMLVMHLTLLVAPAVAGTLLAGPGITAALIVTTALAALVLPFYLRLRTVGEPSKGPRESMANSLRGGVREIWSNGQLRWMFAVLAVMVVFVNTWGAMFPTIAEDVLHRGSGGLGGITLAVGIGAITGAVVAIVMEGRFGDAKQQFIAGAIFAVVIIGVALSTSYPLTLVLTVIASSAGAPFFINNMVASQAATPAAMKAKVVSVRYIVLATQPIGMMLLGAAAEVFGPQAALAGSSAIGILLMGVVGLLAFGGGLRRSAGAKAGAVCSAVPRRGRARRQKGPQAAPLRR